MKFQSHRTLRKATAALWLLVGILISLAGAAWTQTSSTRFPHMAPLSEYLMARDAEIALARSAAPAAISGDAEVLVLGKRNFELAAAGKNGFTCVVERSWSAGPDDPDFWNPKLRGPICFNAAAAKSQIPILMQRTQFILGRASKDEMFSRIKTLFAKGELKQPDPGAMCFMLSKQGYLSSKGGHWRPHLMFFVPLVDPANWGAALPGSPVVMAFKDDAEKMTVFLVPVGAWSDGEAAPVDGH